MEVVVAQRQNKETLIRNLEGRSFLINVFSQIMQPKVSAELQVDENITKILPELFSVPYSQYFFFFFLMYTT